ncbi:MAG: hypothetical protein OXH70_17275 [Acidobacteria bacterium]|nr:hypothetical protein [Acidobacteriota bacterium]
MSALRYKGRDLMADVITKCAVDSCENEIPRPRIEAQPKTKTCSSACSKQLRRQTNVRLSRERRARIRAAKIEQLKAEKPEAVAEALAGLEAPA